jgi:hypothetical protein
MLASGNCLPREVGAVTDLNRVALGSRLRVLKRRMAMYQARYEMGPGEMAQKLSVGVERETNDKLKWMMAYWEFQLLGGWPKKGVKSE